MICRRIIFACKIMIRHIQESDTAHICDIYNYYVEHTTVTFEEVPVTHDEMLGRIRDITAKYPWLVYEVDGKVIGYAYTCPWKTRSAYRHSVECSVYLQHGCGGKKMGSRLYEALFDELGSTDIHAVIGGIAMPNEASIALHKKFGFQKIGHFKAVGFKFDQWVDVAYWERINNG
jgi:L-amino acid N-acyltransferase YncA